MPPPLPSTSRHALQRLVWVLCLVIVYGSLYPFDFQAAGSGEWHALFDSLLHMTNRGDTLSNVVLFLPLGLAARLAWPTLGWGRLLAWCGALALGLQLAQLFLPSRDASLQDVGWNLLGVAVGAALAGSARRLRLSGLPLSTTDTFALALFGLWLAARLTPFVPSLDWQLFKQSLKPLLVHPQWDWARILVQTVLWAVAARLWWVLWAGRGRLALYLMLLPCLFLAEASIVNNVVSLPSVLGAMLGTLLWVGVLARQRSSDSLLTMLLILALLVQGLAPFQLRPVPAEFHWLPMYGFLQQLTLYNVGMLFAKAYIYGSLVWLAQREGGSLRFAGTLAVGLTFAIELAQTRLMGHTPEITDPLIALAMAGVYGAVQSAPASQWRRRRSPPQAE